MASNPLKAIGIIAGAAIGVATATYGAQRVVVRSLSNTSVDFEFHASEQFVVTTSDGTRLVVYRDGPRNTSRPTVVFLHGYAMCSPIWAHQFDMLREFYDIVAIDLRGHGASGFGDDEISLDLLATDLYEIIEQLELQQYVLVGHSAGGVVSMAYLEKYGQLVEKQIQGLCLVSTLAHPPYHHLESLSEALAKFSFMGRAFHTLAEVPLIGFPMARYALGKKASNAVAEFIRHCVTSTDRDVCVKYLQILAEFNFLETLERIVSPASVIVGTSDPVTPLKDADIVAQALGITKTIIKDVGHCPMLESPDEFNIALVDFLDKTGI